MAAALSSWRWPWFCVIQVVSQWALVALREIAACGHWALGTNCVLTQSLSSKVLGIAYTDQNSSILFL